MIGHPLGFTLQDCMEFLHVEVIIRAAGVGCEWYLVEFTSPLIL
jgi:hypothetical protein